MKQIKRSGRRRRYGLRAATALVVLLGLNLGQAARVQGEQTHDHSGIPGLETGAPDVWQRLSLEYVRDGGPERGFVEWLHASREAERISTPLRRARLRNAEDSMDAFLSQHVGGARIPGAAVGIYRDGAPLYQNHRGLDGRSVVNVASVAKTFTAVAVMQLVDRGALRLEDEVGAYFPELHFAENPVGGVPVTVRHLLEHTSGLPYAGRNPSIVESPVRQLRFAVPSQYRAAGEGHFYSNYNYNLLCLLVEKLSGLDFPTYANQQILAPAGMVDSRMTAAANGAGGLNTTANDLARFLEALFAPGAPRRLISRESLALISRPPEFLNDQVPPNGMFYALGVRVQYRDGEPVEIYHTGLWNGALSEIRYYIHENSYLVHVANPPSYRLPGLLEYRGSLPPLAGRYIKLLDELLEAAPELAAQAQAR